MKVVAKYKCLLKMSIMKNIIVTLDFEEHNTVLMDKAVELAKKFGSKVWLIHIAMEVPDFVGYRVGPQYIRDSRAEELRTEHRMLQSYSEKIRKMDVECEGLLISGATVEAILAEAEKLKADLIVIGSHEHSFLFEALLGSTTSLLVKKSRIPLLVVPI